MKILVTGGAGFIGSHLVDSLIEKGHTVVVVDNLSTGKKENLNKDALFYNIDICAPELRGVFVEESIEMVYHLAAQISVRKSVEDPIFDAKANILGSLNLLENCRNFGVKKIIFASTGGALYGDTDVIPTPEEHICAPMSPYGVAKLCIENYLNYYNKVFKLSNTILRFANIYGPRQDPLGEAGVVAIFCNKFLAGEQPIISGNGEQTRDYVYVKDAVKAFALAQDLDGTYNVAMEKEISVNDIFDKLKDNYNSDKERIYGDARPGEQMRSCLRAEKIRKLGWEPSYNIDSGLKETAEWFSNSLK